MGSASIQIDQPLHPSAPVGQPGRARDDLVLGDPVIARNSDNTDVLRWVWALIDIPIGSTAALSSTTAPQVTFTPDVAGSYLLRLMVDDGVEGQIDHKIAAVRDADGFRFPATDEVAAMTNWPGNDEKGWGKDTEDILRGAVGANTLAGVLAVGQTTGGKNIIVSNGDSIVGEDTGSVAFEMSSVVIGPGTLDGDRLIVSSNLGLGPTLLGLNITINAQTISMTPAVKTVHTGDLEVIGKLSVTGLIDPSGLVLDEQISVPFTPPVAGKGTLWCMDVAGVTTLMFTTDTGVTAALATLAGVTLEAVLDAGQTTSGKNIIVSIGDALAGAGGGTVSFSGGVIQLTDTSAKLLWIAGAASGDAPVGGAALVIGDGSAQFGSTIYTGAASVGALLFTDTPGAYQGALRYDHSTDRLYFDAAAVARAFISSVGLDPNAAATYDIGSLNRWRDAWLSRALYIAGGIAGHDAGADDFSLGDGSATARGMTIYSTIGGAIYFADTVAGTQGGIAYVHASDVLALRAGGAARVNVLSGSLSPETDNALELGLIGKRWTTGYFSTGVNAPAIDSAGTLTITAPTIVLTASANVAITNHSYHSVRGSTVRGSTNDLILRWTAAVDNVGSDISYTDSATDGGSWAINTAGMYAINASFPAGAGGHMAIKKAAALSNTYDETSIQAPQFCGSDGVVTSVSWTGFCSINDKIWIAVDTAADPWGTGNSSRVTVARVR